jgi:hypothetical protein
MEITLENLYTFYTIEEMTDDTGFCYIPIESEENTDKMDDKMMNEFNISYELGMTGRSCMWADEVKRRANWVQGETIYGYTREKYRTHQVSWSKNKIGFYNYVIEADGFLSLCFHNAYTMNVTNDTKWKNDIRPCCLYNDKVCESSE